MMKYVKNVALKLSLLALLFTPLALASPSYALFDGARDQACAGANLNDSGCVEGEGEERVSNTLASVVNILSLVLGIIAVIMIIVGGIKFTTSQGDGNSTASARNTIIYAVVGLVVAAMAQIIVRFVLDRV